MEFSTLGELSIGGKGNYGIAASAVSYSNELYTYLRITDITNDGRIDFSGLKSVDDVNAEKYLLKPNDIVFARTGGSTGRNYFYDGYDGKFVYAGFLIKFSINPQKVNPKFIKYYCQSKEYKDWVNSYNTGSTRGNINAQTYASMPIPLLPRKKQDEIASILETIDAKISENIHINENLEQQAQTLYSAWFENFIPFGGEIPSNWSAGCLGDIAKISTASFNPAKNPGVMLEHYSIPAFDEKKFPVFETSDNIKSNKYTLSSSSVLASRLNPETKRIWRPLCISSNAVCSTEFIVFNALNPLMKDFVYTIIDSASFSKWMCSHTTGSTNSRQRTAHAKTLEFKISIPSEDVIKDFCSTVTPMYDLIAENSMEIQRLSKLRDTLLPKLMSGEIDVSNISL